MAISNKKTTITQNYGIPDFGTWDVAKILVSNIHKNVSIQNGLQYIVRNTNFVSTLSFSEMF